MKIITLLLSLFLVTATVSAQSSDDQAGRFNRLDADGTRYLKSGEFRNAIECFSEQVALAPENPGVFYNLACAYALDGNTKEALRNLQISTATGWSAASHAKSDPDLKSLHHEPAFLRIVDLMQDNEERWIRRSECAHTPLDPADMPRFASLSTLTAHYDSLQEAVARNGYRFGRNRTTESRWHIIDQRIAALRRYVSEQDGNHEAEAAAMAIVQRFGDYKDQRIWSLWDMDGPAAVTASDEFIKQFPQSVHLPEVLYLRALAVWFSRDVPQDDAEASAYFPYEAVKQADQHLAEIIRDYPESPIAARALVKRLAINGHAAQGRLNPKIRGLYTLLVDRYGNDEEIMNQTRSEARMVALQMEGVDGFTGTDLSGFTWNLETMKGSVVLIDFWATWCGPCVREIPTLKTAYEMYRDHGLEIVGVSLDRDTRHEFEAWLAKNEITWPQIFDGQGWKSPIANQFNIRSIPCTILLDRDGTVAAVDLRGQDLVSAIAQKLGIPKAAEKQKR